MSARYFCDICGDEIPDPKQQFLFSHGRIKVQVLRSVDGEWNGKHACWNCVRATMGISVDDEPGYRLRNIEGINYVRADYHLESVSQARLDGRKEGESTQIALMNIRLDEIRTRLDELDAMYPGPDAWSNGWHEALRHARMERP